MYKTMKKNEPIKLNLKSPCNGWNSRYTFAKNNITFVHNTIVLFISQKRYYQPFAFQDVRILVFAFRAVIARKWHVVNGSTYLQVYNRYVYRFTTISYQNNRHNITLYRVIFFLAVTVFFSVNYNVYIFYHRMVLNGQNTVWKSILYDSRYI